MFVAAFKFNVLTSPSDFLRTIVGKKMNILEHTEEFDEIYGKIRTDIVNKDIKRE